MSPEHCLKLERWQGPPNVNKARQSEIVLSFKVKFVYSVYSVMKTKGVCLFGLFRPKKIFPF